jgi:hypothetical protein
MMGILHYDKNKAKKQIEINNNNNKTPNNLIKETDNLTGIENIKGKEYEKENEKNLIDTNNNKPSKKISTIIIDRKIINKRESSMGNKVRKKPAKKSNLNDIDKYLDKQENLKPTSTRINRENMQILDQNIKNDTYNKFNLDMKYSYSTKNDKIKEKNSNKKDFIEIIDKNNDDINYNYNKHNNIDNKIPIGKLLNRYNKNSEKNNSNNSNNNKKRDLNENKNENINEIKINTFIENKNTNKNSINLKNEDYDLHNNNPKLYKDKLNKEKEFNENENQHLIEINKKLKKNNADHNHNHNHKINEENSNNINQHNYNKKSKVIFTQNLNLNLNLNQRIVKEFPFIKEINKENKEENYKKPKYVFGIDKLINHKYKKEKKSKRIILLLLLLIIIIIIIINNYYYLHIIPIKI